MAGETEQRFFERTSPWQAATPEVDIVTSAEDVRTGVTDFQNASSLPQLFVAGVGLKRDVDQLLANPMQSFWDNGLGFLVEWCMVPFRPLFEQVTGDPEQMRATAAGWGRMAEFVRQVADQDAGEQQALAQQWRGPASDAYQQQMTEFQDGLRSLADCCAQLKGHLEQVADFFEGLWDILVDIVREFVEGLIITWLAALATSVISAGASVAAAWATSAARISITLSRILTQISKALQWLVRALRAVKQLSETIQQLIKSQKLWVRVALRATGVTGAVTKWGNPMAVGVRAVTGLTGTKWYKQAGQSAGDLAVDQGLTEAGEAATGESQRNRRDNDNMERGFTL
ncbi:WXG100 family type VII secretion target [Goodfellowiella coeruleoviolacea]|uniref:WXG100 family type VII secretion target n=1 Tax=Goodfellowiella coeruleoviolacea TaxID=334858 RepID=A0AAE3GLQ5_9PSEU|nr:WXG100 family type VII secretion target [Goodfellowiella coeruleoviolacea]MCP2169724.1 WXG100 family type VII secretion target [Goodfellowiella coeruleoviolacea]